MASNFYQYLVQPENVYLFIKAESMEKANAVADAIDCRSKCMLGFSSSVIVDGTGFSDDAVLNMKTQSDKMKLNRQLIKSCKGLGDTMTSLATHDIDNEIAAINTQIVQWEAEADDAATALIAIRNEHVLFNADLLDCNC